MKIDCGKGNINNFIMSSVDVDVDINVVSSPEPSPRSGDESIIRKDFQYSNHHTTFNHSTESRLSPPKSPPEHSKTSAGSAYTSFSISSILSRSDTKKGPLMPLPQLPLSDSNGSHDAAMLSRLVLFNVPPDTAISFFWQGI